MANANPWVVVGSELHNVDLGDPINIVTEGHKLTLDQVRKYSALFMGGETATLIIPPVADRLAIKAIDPNKGCNIGLVNRRKILLR